MFSVGQVVTLAQLTLQFEHLLRFVFQSNAKPEMDVKRRMSIDEQQIDEFFKELKTPNNLETIGEEVRKFCEYNSNKRIVLITVIDIELNVLSICYNNFTFDSLGAQLFLSSTTPSASSTTSLPALGARPQPSMSFNWLWPPIT